MAVGALAAPKSHPLLPCAVASTKGREMGLASAPGERQGLMVT